jgi:hypothetical protein
MLSNLPNLYKKYDVQISKRHLYGKKLWYSQEISLNSLYLVKFYISKPKSTGRGFLIKKQTIEETFSMTSVLSISI